MALDHRRSRALRMPSPAVMPTVSIAHFISISGRRWVASSLMTWADSQMVK